MSEKTATQLIPQDDFSQLEAQLNFWESIKDLTITNDEEHTAAGANRATLSKAITDLTNRKKELTADYKKPAAIIDNEYKEVIDKLENGKEILGTAMGEYQMEQDRKEAEAQRKLNAIVEEKRRKEQVAAASEIAKAEKYRTEGREEMAQQAEVRAETHIEKEETLVAPVGVKSKPKGASFKKYYVMEITDLAAAIGDCLSRQDIRRYVMLDAKGLEALQKTCDGTLKIKGCRFIPKYRTTSRTK